MSILAMIALAHTIFGLAVILPIFIRHQLNEEGLDVTLTIAIIMTLASVAPFLNLVILLVLYGDKFVLFKSKKRRYGR